MDKASMDFRIRIYNSGNNEKEALPRTKPVRNPANPKFDSFREGSFISTVYK